MLFCVCSFSHIQLLTEGHYEHVRTLINCYCNVPLMNIRYKIVLLVIFGFFSVLWSFFRSFGFLLIQSSAFGLMYQGPILRIKNYSFFKFAVSVKTDNFEAYFTQQKLMF